MLPAGPLMKEHRLIERMIELMKKELERIEREKMADTLFLDVAIDFIKTYADRCHHGKEEDILFRSLKKKEISSEHKRIMEELIQEHIYGRTTLGKLAGAKDKYTRSNARAPGDIAGCLKELAEFYPKHIEKEDKHFFLPCMEYFSEQEQAAMLDEFWEFDKNLIHEKYNKTVEQYEEK